MAQLNDLAGDDTSCEYPDKLYLSRNQNDFPTWGWKLHDRIFIYLDKTPERGAGTDGQTKRQPVTITAVSTTSNAR